MPANLPMETCSLHNPFISLKSSLKIPASLEQTDKAGEEELAADC